MATLEHKKKVIAYIIDVWYKKDKAKLQVKLEIGLLRAKKENNLKLVKMLKEDLKILGDI